MLFKTVECRRKRGKRWRLFQGYLPFLGWGLLSIVTITLAFRENRLSQVRYTLSEAHKDMASLQNQQVQMQVLIISMHGNE